jgi:putative toxin-antitoxin system antitoxin component (TIGR02293 family)
MPYLVLNSYQMAKVIKTPKLYPKPKQAFSVIEEASVQYETMQEILGGKKLLPKAISGDLDLITLSRSGVKKSSLKSLSNYLGISMDKMSSLMHTSYRNIQRKDDNELLDVYKSEQAIGVAQVVTKGLEIFGSKENMQQWLHSNIIALGEKKPIDLLDTSFGIRMIYRVLGRLEHGVYS